MWNIGFITEDELLQLTGNKEGSVPMALYLLGFYEYLGFAENRIAGSGQ